MGPMIRYYKKKQAKKLTKGRSRISTKNKYVVKEKNDGKIFLHESKECKENIAL